LSGNIVTRLPTQENLGALPSARSGRPIASVNLQAPYAAMQDLGANVARLGATIGAKADQQDEFETERRFQEFRFEQEQSLNDRMRNLEPSNAARFAQEWQPDYVGKAQEFFKTVPDKLKSKYDLKLFGAEADLYGAADNYGQKAHKAYALNTIDDHTNRLAMTGDVAKAKKGVDELIGLEPALTPLEKEELRRDKHRMLEQMNVQQRIEATQSNLLRRLNGEDVKDPIEDPRTIIKDLKSARKEEVQPIGKVDETALSFIRKQEGYTPVAKWDVRQYSVGYGTRGKRGERISKEEAERRLKVETDKVSAWLDKNITVPLNVNQRASLISFGFNLGTDDLERIKDDINAGNNERVAARMLTFNRAEGKPNAGLTRRRREEAAMFSAPGPSVQTAQATRETLDALAAPAGLKTPGNIPGKPDGSVGTETAFTIDSKEGAVLVPSVVDGKRLSEKDAIAHYKQTGEHLGIFETADDARAYTEAARQQQEEAAPTYTALDVQDRTKLLNNVDSAFSKVKAAAAQKIAGLEALAAEGHTYPEQTMTDLETVIDTLKDPGLVASYHSALGVVQLMQKLRGARPTELEAFLRQERAALDKAGSNPELEKRIKTIEKLNATMRKAINSDPLSWAAEAKQVDLPPLDLENPDMLTARRDIAHQVGDFYGQAPKFFTTDERQALQDVLQEGGDNMLNTLGHIEAAFGPDDTLMAVHELGKGNAEAATVGWLMASGGSRAAIDDAAKGIELRRSEGFQSIAPGKPDIAAATPDVFQDALAQFPASQVAAINTANAIYEVRARKSGEAAFNSEMWQEGLRESLGEETVNGVKYGGVVSQGWWTPNAIILPPSVSQDDWRDAIDMITTDDLAAADLGRPIGKSGQAVDLARLKSGTLVQVGNGRYAVATGDPDTPGAEKWIYVDRPEKRGITQGPAPGDVFILDLNKLAPILMRRRPDLFKGGR
jgi:GH24 family phage-related lysozyme (muramidase)